MRQELPDGRTIPGSRLAILCLAAVLTLFAFPLRTPAAVPGGKNILRNGLFADNPERPVHWVTRDSGNLGKFSLTPPAKGERSGILTVQIKKASPQPWTLELRQKLKPALHAGEILYITFEYKISKGYAFHFYWQKDTSPWPKFLSLRISEPVGKWHSCMVAVPIHEDLPPGQTSLSFHLAEKTGVVQFRNAAAIVLAKGMDTRDLETNVEPVFGGDYYDNDWRQKTLAQLEKNRQDDLEIRVVRQGKPVPDVAVAAVQKSRPFSFGVVVQAPLMKDEVLEQQRFQPLVERLGKNRQNLEKFRQAVTDRSLFDTVSFDRALIWRDAVEWGNDLVPGVIDLFRKKGFGIRGFALYIPAFHFAPAKCRQMAGDELLTAVETFIRRQTQRYRGKIDQWCVVHAALTYEEIYDIVGVDSLLKSFAIAKRGAAPGTALFLSDDKALLTPSTGHLEETVELLNWLQAEGAQVDGLILDARLTRPYIAPQAMQTRLDQIARSARAPIYVTNLEVEAAKENIQADMLHDLLLLFYSHPSVRGVMFSRIWAAASINGKSALFRKNMSAKPAAKMIRQLLTDEWITRKKAVTDDKGVVVVHGFHGTYDITVSQGEKAVVKTATLSPGGAKITIALP